MAPLIDGHDVSWCVMVRHDAAYYPVVRGILTATV